MGVVSDAAAAILVEEAHGSLSVDVFSDYQPATPHVVTVCRDSDGLPPWQPYQGLPAVVYARLTILARGAPRDPDGAQDRALAAWRILAQVASRQVTVGGLTVTVTFNASGSPIALDDDDQDRPRYTTSFSATMTGLA